MVFGRGIEGFWFDDLVWFRILGKKFDETLKRVENLLLMINDFVEELG